MPTIFRAASRSPRFLRRVVHAPTIRACLRLSFPRCKECFDSACDLIAVRLEREVPRVEQVRFEVAQIAPIRGGSFRRENEIVLAPDDQRRRLALSEEGLE